MKKLFTKHNLKYVLDALLVIVGTFCMGFAFNVFLNSNKISPSGFAGLSAILSNVLADYLNVHISASVFYLSVNALLFFLSLKKMGLQFAINSAIGVVGYSIFMEVCNFDIGLGSGDLLLCAIYGGVVMGIGLGLVFRGHGSTGGSDMLANILGKRFKFLTVGNLVLIVDTIVVVLSFFAYKDLQLALYSLIAIWIMTKISDVLVAGVQGVRAYYIISNKYLEISDEIMKKVERGVTCFDAQGMYTNRPQKVVMTIVTRAEVAKLRQLVAEIDRDAFMYSTPISEAMGGGFLPLTNKSKKVKENKSELINNNDPKIDSNDENTAKEILDNNKNEAEELSKKDEDLIS